MKRILVFVAFLLASLPVVSQSPTLASSGVQYCLLGATNATTSGTKSTNFLQGVIPSCTVTVYLTGTTTKATIFSNITGSPLANPFTANSIAAVNPGSFSFFAAVGQGYDVVMSGGIPPNSFPSPVTVTNLFTGGSGGPFLPLTGGTLTGPVTGPSFNNVVNASSFPGADLGTKVNNALAALVGGVGIVQVNAAAGLNFGCTQVNLGLNQTLQFTQGGTYLVGGASCTGTGGILMSGINAAIIGTSQTRSSGGADHGGQVVIEAANGANLANGVVEVTGHAGDSIQNVVLDGNKANSGTVAGDPVLYTVSASAVLLSYMGVQNSNGPGILISATTPLDSDADKFDTIMVEFNAGAGIKASNTNDAEIYGGSEIEANGGIGLDCYNCSAWRLTGVDISTNSGDGIYSHTDATTFGGGAGQWSIIGTQERGNTGSCLHVDATAFYQNTGFIVMNGICGIGGVAGANPLGGIQFSNSGRNYVSGVLFYGGGTGQGQYQYDYWEGGAFAIPSTLGSNIYPPQSASVANYLLIPGTTLLAGNEGDGPGSTLVKSVNYVATANAFPGTDMGQKVNNALAFLNGPGIVQINASTPGENFACTQVTVGNNQTLQFTQGGNYFFGGASCPGQGGIVLAGNNAAIIGIGLVRSNGAPPNAQVTLIAGTNALLPNGVVQITGGGDSIQNLIIDGDKANSGTAAGAPVLYINKAPSTILSRITVQNGNGPGISLVSTTANESGSQNYDGVLVLFNAGAGIVATNTSDAVIYGNSQIQGNGAQGISCYGCSAWRLNGVDITANGGDAIYSHSDGASLPAGQWTITAMFEQQNQGACLHTDASATFQNVNYIVVGGLCNASGGSGTANGITFSNSGRNIVNGVVFSGSPPGGQFVYDYFEGGSFTLPSTVGPNIYVAGAASTANYLLVPNTTLIPGGENESLGNGIVGNLTAANVTVTSMTPSSSNVCPNGLNGALTTVGCAGSSTPGSGTITGVTAGTGLTGGGTTGVVALAIANTAVTPGSYTNANVTVNAQGQVTAASNGSGAVGVVAKVNLANQTANISQTAAYTTPTTAAGRYRLSCYEVLTTPATTSSTLPLCWFFFNDQDTGVGAVSAGNSSMVLGGGPSSNTLAQTNLSSATFNSNSVTVNVQSNSIISYGTFNYASSGATAMAYALHLTIEYLGP